MNCNPLTWFTKRDQRYLPKIEVYQALNGEWYSRMRAANGNIVVGPDPYLSGKSGAVEAARALGKQLDIEVRILEPLPTLET